MEGNDKFIVSTELTKLTKLTNPPFPISTNSIIVQLKYENVNQENLKIPKPPLSLSLSKPPLLSLSKTPKNLRRHVPMRCSFG
jgi:hypothetical protein